MRAFVSFTGLVAPLDRANVDTDAIIPKQYLKSIRRTGFGPNLFDGWRYLDPGEPDQNPAERRPNPDFVLNQPRYRGAEILLARSNYGCGSSREHAVWAMLDYGFRAVLASSFADIFYSNACKNGLLAIALDPTCIERLFAEVFAHEGYRLDIDLQRQRITVPTGEPILFDVPPDVKKSLLEGLDDVALSLAYAERIRAYERRRAAESPWLFPPSADSQTR